VAYEPGRTNVTGHLDVAQTGNPSSIWQAEFLCVKSSDSPSNKLTWQAGSVTNETQQILHYQETSLFRSQSGPTNYYGLLNFADGNLVTVPPDYFSWAIFIDDLNDTDGDGIPDFSDDPSGLPRLGVVLGTTNVLLTVTGEVGHLHEILSSEVVPASLWQTNLSVTLSTRPETFSLPRPTGTTFWQVRAF
jgi:hypothetical protein